MTKGNEFFAGASKIQQSFHVKPPKQINRYGLRYVTSQGKANLINNFENRAIATRSMMAATESNLPTYRHCTFELVRLCDDVVVQTAKHKTLLKKP